MKWKHENFIKGIEIKENNVGTVGHKFYCDFCFFGEHLYSSLELFDPTLSPSTSEFTVYSFSYGYGRKIYYIRYYSGLTRENMISGLMKWMFIGARQIKLHSGSSIYSYET